MPRFARFAPVWRASALGLVVLAAGGCVRRAADQPADDTPPVASARHPANAAVGRGGCSATACHGGPAPSLTAAPAAGCWQGSATHWLACDPHRRAFEVLDSPLADAIVRRLRWEVRATEHERCLACHTNPTLAKTGTAEQRAEGVSCEACHGNAGDWQYSHTVTKNRFLPGMTALNDLGVRAKTCAGCHVGAPASGDTPARDVNHDLIAAGHPRLDFDFADSHNRLPKHWREKTPLSEPHLWLIGRVAHAEAASELLASRAGHRDGWPELSEFNCAACHRGIPDAGRESDGRLRWQSVWPITRADEPKATELKGLVELMGRKQPPTADEAKAKAAAAAGGLSKWRKELAATPDSGNRYFPPSADTLRDRDDLYHLLLGLAASERGKERERRHVAEFDRAFGRFREWHPGAANPAKAERDARAALNDLLAIPR